MRLKSTKCNLFFALIFSIFIADFSHGQDEAQLEAYKKKYAGQHLVRTKTVHVVRISLVKEIPQVTHVYENEFLILDKNGGFSISEESIEFSVFEQINNIKAYSMVPKEKGGYKKVPATNFFTADAEAEGGIFHDGGKATTFVYPSLQEGAYRYLYYESTISEHSFPFGFQFYSYYPTENMTFRLEMDSAIHVVTQEYFTDLVDVVKTEKNEKGMRIIEWTCPSSLMIKPEDRAAEPRYYAPHVLAQISHFYANNKKTNVIRTIEDLHNKYQVNVEEVVNEKPSEILSQIADSITQGLTTDFDKAKAVYYWVQDNIKYIAFEEGMGGYVPRQPSRIINKRYGDCKDMASLIYSMLKSVNVESYLTWIGSRSLPYKYTEFPSSFCDNHMITAFKDKGKYYFLDATDAFQKIETPTGFIQGKQAMVHLGKDKFEVVEVPIPPAEYTRLYDTTKIEIVDRNLKGKSVTEVSGYYHVYIGNYYKNVTANEVDKFVTNVNQKCNNSYKAENAVLKGIDDRDKNLIMTYDWQASNYVTSLADEIYVNMILEKEFAMGEIKDKRIAPFELDNKTDDNYTVILKKPAGYEVKDLPKDHKYSTDFMDFSVTYTNVGDEIHMTLHLKLDFLLLPPDRFNEWNEFVKVKKNAIGESVLLTKIK
jgi:transglutaminase-like putative cysteine protease